MATISVIVLIIWPILIILIIWTTWFCFWKFQFSIWRTITYLLATISDTWTSLLCLYYECYVPLVFFVKKHLFLYSHEKSSRYLSLKIMVHLSSQNQANNNPVVKLSKWNRFNLLETISDTWTLLLCLY